MDNQFTELDLTEFVQWTHLYSALMSIVRDRQSSYYGKFCVLVEEGEAKYLTVEELYEFYKNNPDWVSNVYDRRHTI